MTPTALTLALSLLLAADTDGPRRPNPIAPSLPLLTPEEEQKLDDIIDKFIQFDTGRLKGADGKKALEDFQKLGPEALPALIRGVNRAAGIEATCPAATIGKKIHSLVRATTDLQLLEFARDNIGAGVERSPHMAILKDLRFICLLRKRDVQQRGIAFKPPPPNPMARLSVDQLVKATASERGSKLREVVLELGQRRGDAAFNALAAAATHYEADIAVTAREQLTRHLARMDATALKERLKDDRTEVRAAAVRAAADKKPPLGAEIIDRLEDKEAAVREAAHKALVALARGTDHGPKADTKDADKAEAVRQWRAWWAKQGK
jgi:hypothetical protein